MIKYIVEILTKNMPKWVERSLLYIDMLENRILHVYSYTSAGVPVNVYLLYDLRGHDKIV